MEFHRVSGVTPLPDFNLRVKFQSGEEKLYDVKPLFVKFEEFRALTYVPGLFELVSADPGGYGIVWNENIDLSCNSLYYGGYAP